MLCCVIHAKQKMRRNPGILLCLTKANLFLTSGCLFFETSEGRVFIWNGQGLAQEREYIRFLPRKENRSRIYLLTSELIFFFRSAFAFIYVHQHDRLSAWYLAHRPSYVATRGISWPLPLQILLQDNIVLCSNPTDIIVSDMSLCCLQLVSKVGTYRGHVLPVWQPTDLFHILNSFMQMKYGFT